MVCARFLSQSIIFQSLFILAWHCRKNLRRKVNELIDALAGHSFFTPVYRNEVAAFAGALQVEMMGGFEPAHFLVF